MPDNSNKITSLKYLEEISKGDTSFIKEMIGVFLAENPKELNELETAISQKKYDHIKETAHKMKSTIPFVGLDKLIEKDLIEIEDLALKKTSSEKIHVIFQKIKTICQSATTELKDQLNNIK